MIGQRPVHILRITRLLAEPGIEICHEFRRISVGCLNRIDAAKAQLLDQPILQRLVGALHTAFGLRGVGADNVDVQLIKRAPELR